MVIQIQSPRDLFLYDLSAMYDMEQKMSRMLSVLAQECMNPQALQAFTLHEQETQQHIRNLERCFQILGSQPIAIENYTAAGLQRDHDFFLLQKPPAEAVTLFVLHSGYQSECLEIAAYHDLIEKANNLGLQDCVLLFQQNLQQEVNASTTLATIAHQLGQQQADAVQNSVAPAPMSNQSNIPMPAQSNAVPNAPMPNQPNVPPAPPMPNQPDAAVNAPMTGQSFVAADPQVPTQPSVTGNSSTAPQVQEGMQVVGSDMSNVGFVREVREDDFLVDIPIHRDLFVPFSAIQNVDAERVMLSMPGDQIYDMGWPKPPLL